MKLPLRLLLATVGGALAYLTFPRLGIWILLFPLVATLYVSIRGVGFWRGLLIGAFGGFAFFASQVFWVSQYLGPEPLLFLAGGEGLLFAVSSGLLARTQLSLSTFLQGPWLRLGLALTAAIFWTSREWFSGHFPYGGFPWARLAMSQSDTILSHWVYLGGMPLTSFVIVFVTVWVFETLLATRDRNAIFISASAAVALFVIPLCAPISNAPENGTLRVAAVQGNANAGLFANLQIGSIRDNHIEGTNQLLASKEPFDVVVWPENAVDVDVMGNSEFNAQLGRYVDTRIKKPLIFGTITLRKEGLFNSSLLWEPGKAVTDWYDKQRPVPFAEYVPDREFWEKVSPLVSLINHAYEFGTRDGIFEVDGKKLGVLICFEVAVDEISENLVNQNAEVILSQTNNADFGQSDEAYQQLAIARLRAIETGRAVVNISTVGPSAIFLPDGTVVKELNAFTRGYLVSEVPLRTSKTPAMFIAKAFDQINFALSVLLAGGGVLVAIRPRRRGKK